MREEDMWVATRIKVKIYHLGQICPFSLAARGDKTLKHTGGIQWAFFGGNSQSSLPFFLRAFPERSYNFSIEIIICYSYYMTIQSHKIKLPFQIRTLFVRDILHAGKIGYISENIWKHMTISFPPCSLT